MSRWPRFVLPWAAALLAAWSLVPLAVWWDNADPAYFSNAWATWLTGSAVAALAVALALVLGNGRIVFAALGLWRRLARVTPRTFVAIVALLFAALSVLCTLKIFDGNPRNVDGFAQLFQARIFLSGHLTAPPPAELANFATLQMILGPKWFSQYPPGQSVVLAIGLLAGAWWLLNPLLAAVLGVVTWRVARWCTDDATARLSLILLCVSMFAIAVAGSEMSHLAAATLGMAAAALAVPVSTQPDFSPASRPLRPLASGLALGVMTSFRPLDAVAASIVVGVIIGGWSSTRIRDLVFTGIGGILGSIPVLWFNARTTGHASEFGYIALWGPQHSLGFHPVPWGIPLTFTRAVARSGADLHQLNMYLIDATIPILVMVALGFVAGRRLVATRDVVPFVGVASLIGPLFFYWHRDVFYGPRFLYSVVPWFLILLARALVLLRRSSVRPDGGGVGLVASFALIVSLLTGLVALTPSRLDAYRRSTPIFSLHPDRDAKRAGVTNAVVVIPDGWATRLIARMWQAGVPVRVSSQLYAAIDACTLENALDAAEQRGDDRTRLLHTLDSLAALHRPGTRTGTTADANLRLPVPGELTDACRAEIDVDRRGFYQYAPFLWLNRATLDGPVVWARDLGPRNAALFRRYAGRRFYRYAPSPNGAPMIMPVTDAGW